MSLVKCPYCLEEIRVEAKKCKHCGEWLDRPTPHVSPAATDTSHATTNASKKDAGPVDRWCPNCRQMVRPKEDHQPTAGCLVALAIGVASFWLLKTLGITNEISGVLALAIAGIALNFFKDKGMRTDYSCPICQSKNLQQSEPQEVAVGRLDAAGAVVEATLPNEQEEPASRGDAQNG